LRGRHDKHRNQHTQDQAEIENGKKQEEFFKNFWLFWPQEWFSSFLKYFFIKNQRVVCCILFLYCPPGMTRVSGERPEALFHLP
jgi:hypothetical protein